MNSVETTQYKVYSYRWIVLLLFGLVTLINQMIWITFAAIEPSAIAFYGVKSNAILMFSLVFMIVYIPMNIPAAMLIDKLGLKWGTGIGVIITGVFGILRAVPGPTGYAWVLVFQIGCAIGQPFLLNSFTKVSTNWFPEKEKALSTSLGTMFVLLGVLLGMLITPFLMIPAGDPTIMLYIYGGMAIAFMVLYLIFVRDKPETPPNAYSDKTKVFETKGTWDLFKHKDFNILLILFLFGAGTFNAASTGIAQLFNSLKVVSIPPGFTPDDLLGILGGIMIVGGIAGAITLSTLSDKYQKRKPFLITSAIAGAVCTLLFFFVEYFIKSFLPLYIAHCVIGFFFGFLLIAALPVGLTYAAEITYPIPEETSNGWLMWIGQIGGIALLGVMFGMKTNIDVFNFIIYAAILTIAAFFAFRMKDLDAYKLK